MKAVRDIDDKMEQASIYYAALEYVRIQKGRGFVCAVGNQSYTRVKTEVNVKYLKCCKIGCDGSAKHVDEVMYAGVRRPNTISAVLLTIM